MRLRVICRVVPPEYDGDTRLEFGLLDKQGPHAGRAGESSVLQWDVDFAVKGDVATEPPRLVGPFVHGTAAEPFLYLGLRPAGIERGKWIRRMKIPLRTITWEQIAAVNSLAHGYLRASVDIFGSHSTAPLPDGWVVEQG